MIRILKLLDNIFLSNVVLLTSMSVFRVLLIMARLYDHHALLPYIQAIALPSFVIEIFYVVIYFPVRTLLCLVKEYRLGYWKTVIFHIILLYIFISAIGYGDLWSF